MIGFANHMIYEIGSYVEVVNHSEPTYTGQCGTVLTQHIAFNGYTIYYDVELDGSRERCICTDDELTEV